jgi:hypothetical protein
MHVNGLRNKFCEADDSVLASARECLSPMFSGKGRGCETMPVFSSGQWAGQAFDTWARLGSSDLIHAAGGGIMAHPAGPEAGIASIRLAWQSAMAGPNARTGRRRARGAAAGHGKVRLMIPPLALTYYGDDFTGSTDVMEVLTWAGLETVLFVEPPSADRLARFPHARAIGLAGESRGRSPQWMDEHLPALLGRLGELDAPLCHYKVCSTFDSSPTVGSIGRALEIGQDLLQAPWVPIVVGAPALSRYQAFGNLFATVGAETHRLDRHPTMSRHPVTPMHEADLRLHLAAQTSRRIGLVDILALQSEAALSGCIA